MQPTSHKTSSWLAALRTPTAAIALGAVLLVGAAAFHALPQAFGQEQVQRVPAPAVDEPATDKTETTVLAGGCFWGVQGVFQHVKGVISATSGYIGGAAQTAQYETVSGGDTGHAESVQIVFDPRQVSYGRLLQIYFSVVQDPTELNYQGPDSGTQYRSEIFASNDAQAKVARAYIAQLDQAHVFHAPIVTTVGTGKTFYPAEAYHQNFLTNHPDYPYIVVNDLPKVQNLKQLFAENYRADPVLVQVAQH